MEGRKREKEEGRKEERKKEKKEGRGGEEGSNSTYFHKRCCFWEAPQFPDLLSPSLCYHMLVIQRLTSTRAAGKKRKQVFWLYHAAESLQSCVLACLRRSLGYQTETPPFEWSWICSELWIGKFLGLWGLPRGKCGSDFIGLGLGHCGKPSIGRGCLTLRSCMVAGGAS